jgi:hypothetical protein
MMLHGLFDDGDWFPPKRYGYGAGLPFAWQGWVVLGSYMLLVIGVALGIARTDPVVQLGGAVVILAATALLVLIISKRTRGGFRWRWGEED